MAATDELPKLIPHIMGITLDGTGVANTFVTAKNRTTGDKITKRTDSSKAVIFDASNFANGYSTGDIIDFINSGGSTGKSTITIDSEQNDFQSASMTNAAAPTVSTSI